MQKILDDDFLLRPHDIENGKWYTMFTSALGHSDWTHLGCNMVSVASLLPSLWSMNPVMLSVLMIGSTASASAAWIWHTKRRDTIRETDEGTEILLYGGRGASGMVMGLCAAAALRHPWSPLWYEDMIKSRLIICGLV